MFKFVIVVACAFVVASSSPAWHDEGHGQRGYTVFDNDSADSSHSGSHVSYGGGKNGYSAGSGLRNIAQGSAQQAFNAVQNQILASKQAAFTAKNTLAQAAAGNAATAQAALAGKQLLLQGLEQQVRDAEVGLNGEQQQLQQAERAAQATQRAADQARQQVNVLNSALNSAQATLDQANEASTEAANEFASQTAMVGTAQQRLESLQDQLHRAQVDFDATQAAAQKAASAAQVAQSNAAEAAAAAAAHGSGGAGGNGGDGHYYHHY